MKTAPRFRVLAHADLASASGGLAAVLDRFGLEASPAPAEPPDSDIFDALTATDRPYKRAVSLDRALAILKSEADAGKLDAGLLDVFIAGRVHEAAASYRPDADLLMGAENRA